MLSTTSRRFAGALWRGVKVLFGAWGFAVACVILTGTLGHIALGPRAAQWVFDHLHYATILFFVVGLPIMLRWLR